MSGRSPAELLPVEEAYRLWAPNYDATPNPLLSLERRFLSPLLGSAAGCDVVDLGCGTGRWLTQFETVGARSITGIDISAEMLERASLRAGSSARLIQTDCLNTSLPAASSDWILASFLLSYVADLQAFAKEASRIARPGALVLLSDLHPATRSYGWKRTFRSAQRVIEVQSQSYEIAGMRRAMEKAGFEQVLLHELPFGDQEREIFLDANRPDLFDKVKGLPVLFVAGFRRESE